MKLEELNKSDYANMSAEELTKFLSEKLIKLVGLSDKSLQNIRKHVNQNNVVPLQFSARQNRTLNT